MLKKMVATMMALLVMVAFLPVQAIAAEDEMTFVATTIPDDWESPSIWAFTDDGVSAFDAWPGGSMKALDGNDGWYYLWIPAETDNIIISANAGEVQTAEAYKLESNQVWVTVESAETVTISNDQLTEGDVPEYVPSFNIYAQVDETWESVNLWAWSAPDGTNAYDGWPGETMTLQEDGWYVAEAPEFVNSIIINGNEGTVQTEDISIDPADVWVTVEADGTFDFTYNDPNAPVAADVTLYAQMPADWEAPSAWAWSAPDGTNAFSGWPGEAMVEADGWYSVTIPGWVNSVIINANEGTVQTTDLAIELEVDVWVVVTDAETAEVYYEMPEVESTSEETEEVVADTEEVAEEAADVEVEEAEEAEDGSSVGIIIGVVVVVLAAAGVVVYKKKRA